MIEAGQNFGLMGDAAQVGVVDGIFTRGFGEAREVGHRWQLGGQEVAFVILFERYGSGVLPESVEVERVCGGVGFVDEADALPLVVDGDRVEFFALVVGTIGDAPVVEIEGARLLLHFEARDAGVERAYGGHKFLTAGMTIGQRLQGERAAAVEQG